MAKNISSILINAPKQRVWDCLTKPELVKQWQYGSNLITNWREGTRIEFVTPWEDKVFKQWGSVLEFKPPTSLRYNLFAPRPDLEDRPENYFVMSYQLSEEDEQTRVKIIQEDNRPNAVQEEPQGEENPVLQALKQLAESKS